LTAIVADRPLLAGLFLVVLPFIAAACKGGGSGY
jgi:hypothetical protein